MTSASSMILECEGLVFLYFHSTRNIYIYIYNLFAGWSTKLVQANVSHPQRTHA